MTQEKWYLVEIYLQFVSMGGHRVPDAMRGGRGGAERSLDVLASRSHPPGCGFPHRFQSGSQTLTSTLVDGPSDQIQASESRRSAAVRGGLRLPTS